MNTLQPAWMSFALALLLALVSLAGFVFGLSFKTNRLSDDGSKMSKKIEEMEERMHELVTMFKVALERQTAMNEVILQGMKGAVDKLEKLEGRVMTSEAALLIITNRWPEILELAKRTPK